MIIDKSKKKKTILTYPYLLEKEIEIEILTVSKNNVTNSSRNGNKQKMSGKISLAIWIILRNIEIFFFGDSVEPVELNVNPTYIERTQIKLFDRNLIVPSETGNQDLEDLTSQFKLLINNPELINYIPLQLINAIPRGGAAWNDYAWLVVISYMLKYQTFAFQPSPIVPPNYQIWGSNNQYQQPGNHLISAKGVGPRTLIVRQSQTSEEENYQYVFTQEEAFQELNKYYGGHVWEISLFGDVYKNSAQQLASHLKHGKGLGYIPRSLPQKDLEDLNKLGIVKYTRLGRPLPSLEDCKGMHDKIVELFTDIPMVPITELDLTNLEESIARQQSTILYDLYGGRRERGEIKPGKSFYKLKDQTQLLYDPETNNLISAQKRSRPKAFFGNIEKFSSLNPVVKAKFGEYYKNQDLKNMGFSIDSNYSINARFLNISKFNETANDSNTPSGNKTIIILPPEPKNN